MVIRKTENKWRLDNSRDVLCFRSFSFHRSLVVLGESCAPGCASARAFDKTEWTRGIQSAAFREAKKSSKTMPAQHASDLSNSAGKVIATSTVSPGFTIMSCGSVFIKMSNKAVHPTPPSGAADLGRCLSRIIILPPPQIF